MNGMKRNMMEEDDSVEADRYGIKKLLHCRRFHNKSNNNNNNNNSNNNSNNNNNNNNNNNQLHGLWDPEVQCRILHIL